MQLGWYARSVVSTLGRRLWLFVVLVLASAAAFGCRSDIRLTGTSLGGDRAPDFHLRDRSGQGYSLDQFRGKVIILTFLYTSCPDYCPLTAELLRHADEAAGHPKNVVYLAVSVDPVGDTPANIATFEQTHHLDDLGDRWHYLVGDRAELLAVWRGYYIGVTAGQKPGETDHTSVVYFIDKSGERRVVTELDVPAEQIARNVLLLARQ